MPGLQSLVSAWVKVNQGHGEYFGDVSSVRDATLSASSSAVEGQQLQMQQQQQMQQSSPPQAISSSLVPPSFLPPEGMAMTQQPSSSSLSTYNLSKGASLSTGATGALTSSPLYQPAQPVETRSLLHSQLSESSGVTLPQHSHALRPNMPNMNTLPQHPIGSIHRRSRPPNTLNTHHHVNYHSRDAPPPHPQAGADAILGRRKSSSSGGGASVASNNPYRRKNSSEAVPQLRPISAEESDNSGLLSRSISEYDKSHPLNDTLDRVRAGFSLSTNQNNLNRFNYDDGSFGTNDSFRRDLNSINARDMHYHRESKMSQITDSSSEVADDQPLQQQQRSLSNESSKSAAIPIPKNKFRSQKFKKSYSRTDLVREMALDRNHRSRNKSSSGNNLGDADSSNSNNNSPRRNSSFLSLALSGGQEESDGESLRGGGDGAAAGVTAAGALGVGSAAVAAVNTNSNVGLDTSMSKNSVQTSSIMQSPLMSKNSLQAGSMTQSPLINSVQASPVMQPPSMSKNSVQASSIMLSPEKSSGTSSTIGASNLSLDTSLGTNSVANNSSKVPPGGASLSSASIPNRNNMMQPGWFPYHSEQEHLMRASFLSRRSSGSTVETGNLGPRQAANANNQGEQTTGVSLGTTSAVAARQITSSDCAKCSQMEATLLSLQADVEYLRTLELQREFICIKCESGHIQKAQSKSKKSSAHVSSKLHPPSIPENAASSVQSESSAISAGSRTSSRHAASKLKRHSAGSIGGTSRSTLRASLHAGGSRTASLLRDASRRLGDLSTRHKRQVKQSTHERAYWQNDMHLKLEKFAMMAKNLNEEAAKRSNEVKETQATLDKVTSERNGLVSQVEMLKARVKLYEEESVDYEKMRKEWENEELQTLAEMERKRKDQDVIIHDLSMRLDLAIKTIETERRMQQQRRQIIFPSSRQNSSSLSKDGNTPPSPHQKGPSAEPTLIDDLEGIKKTTKETARKYHVLLESAMVQSSAREKEMQDRIAALEQELRDAKMGNSSTSRELGVGERSLSSSSL